MKQTRLLALIAGATLAFSGAVLAQTPTAKQTQKVDKKGKAATSSLHGSVKSLSDSEIVVTQKGKDLTLTLNSETQKQGDIKSGSEVAVQYRFDNGKDVAIRIQALPPKNVKKG